MLCCEEELSRGRHFVTEKKKHETVYFRNNRAGRNPDTALDPNFEEKSRKTSCANFLQHISFVHLQHTVFQGR
jgi:hypothetical protein